MIRTESCATNASISPISQQPNSANLQGRRAEVIWGLGHEEGRTWMGWFYTLGQVLKNIICCNPSWTLRKEITVADKHWHLVTPEWCDLAVIVLPILNGEMMEHRELLFNVFQEYGGLSSESSIVVKITDFIQNTQENRFGSNLFIKEILETIDMAKLPLTEHMIDATLSLVGEDRDINNLGYVFEGLASIESREEIEDVVRHAASLCEFCSDAASKQILLQAISYIPKGIREEVIAKAVPLAKSEGVISRIIDWYSILLRCSEEVANSRSVVSSDMFQRGENSIPPYSSLGEEAIAFARRKISERSDIPSQIFRGQSTDEEIAQLSALYNSIYSTITTSTDNPIHLWDEFMKIGFAISCLTLDKLDLFIEREASRGFNKTRTLALTRQDSYQYCTFFACTKAYHIIRGEGSSSRFYQEGTSENSWNSLYNEFCDRVREYVNEKRLAKADGRFVNGTRKDTGPSTFEKRPDTLPT